MRFDPRTGGMIRDKPSPDAFQMAREFVGAIYQHHGRAENRPKTWDQMTHAEQAVYIRAAQQTISRLRL